jgi:hypothetical protein
MFLKQNDSEGNTPTEQLHKMKSNVLQKLMVIQQKNVSFKEELVGLKGSNDEKNDNGKMRKDTINSSVSTVGSKNSSNKLQALNFGDNKKSNVNTSSVGKKSLKKLPNSKIVINAGSKK